MGVSLLGTQTLNTTSGTHTVVATPAVGDLIVIVTANTGNVSNALPTDNNADGLGTYTLINGANKAASADLLLMFVRNSLVGSAGSTTFTHAPGTSTGGGLAVLKVTNMNRAGSSAVRQNAIQDNQSAAGTPTPVFGLTPLANAPIIAAVFNATSPATMTPRTSYTELLDVGYSTPTTGLEVMSRDSGETSASIAWGGTSATAFGSMAIELVPNVALTQASFGFYEDGTETASATTAAQDTSISRNVSSDSNILLRLRQQNTSATPGLTTDDFQLQFSLNGGTFADVGSGQIIDQYGIDNSSSSSGVYPLTNNCYGQSIVGTGLALVRHSWMLQKVGSPTGTASISVYATTGTHGTSAIPTGSPLATATINVATIPTTAGLVPVDFGSPATLTNGVTYAVTFEFTSGTGDAVNKILMYQDSTSPTHGGNSFSGFNNASYSPNVSLDMIFASYWSTASTIVGFNSASLTDGGATTNRLGAGTGSFVAGKISEDGLVDDHQITASNYTEYLYSMTLVSAQLAATDTLDFRVLRNGASTGMTYTVTPRITVTKSSFTSFPNFFGLM